MSADKTSSPTRHAIAKTADIPLGECRIARLPAFGKEIEIGVFHVGEHFFAYRNVCPHAGAPVCEGKICGTTAPSEVGVYLWERIGEILRCPWHGWEFDLITGEHLVDRKKRLRSYPVEIEAEQLENTEQLENYAVEVMDEVVFVLIAG